MGVQVGGFFGLVLLIASIYAVVKIAQSGATTAAKVVWITFVVVLPVIGLIAWFFVGPKG